MLHEALKSLQGSALQMCDPAVQSLVQVLSSLSGSDKSSEVNLNDRQPDLLDPPDDPQAQKLRDSIDSDLSRALDDVRGGASKVDGGADAEGEEEEPKVVDTAIELSDDDDDARTLYMDGSSPKPRESPDPRAKAKAVPEPLPQVTLPPSAPSVPAPVAPEAPVAPSSVAVVQSPTPCSAGHAPAHVDKINSATHPAAYAKLDT